MLVFVIERKIQKVGGSSFSVSLPKEWVKKSGLRSKSSVFFSEFPDGALMVSSGATARTKPLESFSIKLEEHVSDFYQVLFAAYYLGAEKISIFSEKEIPDSKRSKIKETLQHMSATEVVSEDSKKIVLNVLLDKSKVNANNLLSRIGLILHSSIKNCSEKMDLEEIQRNELEIDRLFNLVSKIITVSLIDSSIMHSSGIKHNFFVVPYFLISKKLENIADEIEDLALYIKKNRRKPKEIEKLLSGVQLFVKKHIVFPVTSTEPGFSLPSKEEKEKIEIEVSKLTDPEIRSTIRMIYRLLYDVQEELVNISFYNKLLKEKVI